MDGLKDINYWDRLEATGLISLEKRRIRGNLIQFFKIVKGINKMDYKKFFEVSTLGRTRGHSLTLLKNRRNWELRRNF